MSIQNLSEIFVIALWGVLYTTRLTEHGKLFGWLKTAVSDALISKKATTSTVKIMLLNVLCNCSECHAGQVCFWYFLFAYGINQNLFLAPLFCVGLVVLIQKHKIL